MERHWNVLKFTCGLMEDSSVLIERICQAFVEIATTPKPRQSFCQLYGCLYLKDLHREKSAVSRNPFNNPHLCYNNHRCMAAINAENRNYELYYFNGWDKGESIDEKWEQHSESKGTNQVEHLKPCSVVIHQGLSTPMKTYLLTIDWFIRQPIKSLLIFGENSQQSDYNDVGARQGNPLNASVVSAENVHLLRDENIYAEPYGLDFGISKVKHRSVQGSESVSRFTNISEPFKPSFGIGNQPEAAMGYIERRRDPVSRSVVTLKLDYLRVAVFHKLNCSDLLADSLCHCTMLTHLSYVKCRNLTFDTLGNNKELRELTVENCLLRLNTEAELYAQLRHLKQLEHISFIGMKYMKQLARFTRAAAFSLTSLKRLSLQDCMLTTSSAVALMESLVHCSLVELDLSDNFLVGFIKELRRTPDVAFKHLERINYNNCDLLETDTMALARLVSENRLPVVKTIFMKGNILANHKAASEELENSCEHFRRRKGHRVQVYMDRSNEMRKRNSRDEVRHDKKEDQMKDIDKKDEVKDSNKKNEVQSSVEENETKTSNWCNII